MNCSIFLFSKLIYTEGFWSWETKRQCVSKHLIGCALAVTFKNVSRQMHEADVIMKSRGIWITSSGNPPWIQRLMAWERGWLEMAPMEFCLSTAIVLGRIVHSFPALDRRSLIRNEVWPQKSVIVASLNKAPLNEAKRKMQGKISFENV